MRITRRQGRKRRHSDTAIDGSYKSLCHPALQKSASADQYPMQTIGQGKSILDTKAPTKSSRNTAFRKISDRVSDGQYSIRQRITTEKTTIILVAIVVLFVITHSYRLALKIYEVVMPQSNTMESFQRCYSIGR